MEISRAALAAYVFMTHIADSSLSRQPYIRYGFMASLPSIPLDVTGDALMKWSLKGSPIAAIC